MSGDVTATSSALLGAAGSIMKSPRIIVSLVGLLWLYSSAAEHAEEPFIGWQGETYRPQQPGEHLSDQDTRRWIETISWSPRAFIYHNFLSLEEVNHVVDLVEKEVKPSRVVDTKTGQHMLDSIRTSYGGAIMRGQDAVVASIEARIAEWTRLPADHGEPIQVLRYQNGQKYDAHWDWFDDPTHPATSEENRAATVLMYLGEVQEGGETAMPLGTFIDEGKQKLPSASECAKKGTGMAIAPKKGDALLFWDMHVDGKTVDRASLHASCPTLKGTKWTATKWIHNRPYGAGYDPLKQAALCKDTADDCKALSAEGKCDTDAAKMLGLTGICRKTCDDCIECAESDIICLRKNMRSLRAQRLKQQQPSAQAHA